MKPCRKNRKPLTWLALEELDAPRAQTLREHLAMCEGCHQYLAEISSVTAKLSAQEPVSYIKASATFHKKIAARLQDNEPNSAWEIAMANLTRLSWRVATPAVAALLVVLVVVAIQRQQPAIPSHCQLAAKIIASPDLPRDLSPTFANYQRVANESPEKLDQLLTEQGNQNLSASPIYRASTRLPANGSF